MQVDQDIYKAYGHLMWTADVRLNADGTESVYAYRRGPAKSQMPRKKIYLHRVIVCAPSDKVVDHKDRNTFDCRRKNLRVCTQRQNVYNIRKAVPSKNKWKGITRQYGKWIAQIQVDGKKYVLARCNCPTKAALAYDAASKEHFGLYGDRNFRKDGTTQTSDQIPF